MLFLHLGIDQNVVNEHHYKFVKELHEHLVHEIHEVGRGVGQAKGHHGVLKQTITGGEGGLGNIGLSDFQLMISGTEINLGEYLGSIQLIKQVFDFWEQILVFNSYLIEFTIVHTQSNGTVPLVHKKNRQTPR
jgi:hypothetical protein